MPSWKIKSFTFLETCRIMKVQDGAQEVSPRLPYANSSLVILLSSRLKKAHWRQPFGWCQAGVSGFTARLRALLSVWSWCRQAVTFGLKYKYRDSPQVCKLCYLEVIQTGGSDDTHKFEYRWFLIITLSHLWVFFVLFHVTKANLVHQENEFTVIEMCAQLFRKYFYP